MNTGLEQVRQVMADYLCERGVPAVTAWPAAPRQEWTEPVVVVSLRGCRAGSASFQDYLGERYDERSGRWEERFGKRAQLTLGLDIYAPQREDGEAVQSAFDALAGVLVLGGPEGLDLQEFSCGQTAWDGERRRLKRPVEAVCTAWLCAVTGTDGTFVDFELRGVMKE